MFMRTGLLALALLTAPLLAQQHTPFDPGCPLPPSIDGPSRDVDEQCGIEGKGGNNQRHNDASRAKNNFCATGNTITLTFANFDRLQDAAENAEIPTGTNKYPDDRADVQDMVTINHHRLGEGDRVRLVAWVLTAHYSNVDERSDGTAGEHVNCSKPGEDWNDIHIALVTNKNNPECTSITAELSPHHRPDAWLDPADLLNLQFPVRMTGQLFYDSIHKPCNNGHGSAPRRRASWEIHPVYQIDVCTKKSLANCPADGNNWTPLATFLEQQEEEEPEQ